MIRNPRWMWSGLFAALLLAWLLSLTVGSVRIPIREVVNILFGGKASQETWAVIVMDFRLPKSITALLAGSALAIAGLQMQTLFRNPLADPYILGVSSGASLGAALVILLAGGGGVHFLAKLGFLGDASVILAAALGALAVFAGVALLARQVHTVTLLVLGVLVGYLVNALVRILIHFSLPEQAQAYLSWTFGSFGGVSWRQLILFAPAILLGILMSVGSIKSLNGLLLGETYARSLGISPRKARWRIVLSASLLAGTVTAFCGLIGFIGIAVPHLARSLLRSSDHREALPASAILGGAVALLADVLSQLPGSAAILPLNSVTALIGAPIIIWVILKQRNLRSAFHS
ncbi:MAG: iron ABC transporter permease [Chloroflexi bacterium]|nr:iron ABC transporter permease [Chloroflexota bacterium]